MKLSAMLLRQMDLKVASTPQRLYMYANLVHSVTSYVLSSLLEEK
jgi:hypothetical protein